MINLIAALYIFLRYNPGDVAYPTHCEHDTLYVYPGVSPSDVSEEDLAELAQLGFTPSDEFEDGWVSYKYGSC